MVVRMLYGLAMDILMSTGATRWNLFINIGWVVAVIPALWFGTKAGGATGAAVANMAVGVLVALPLSVIALERAGVRLAPIAPRLIRPVLAGGLAGAVALGLHVLLGRGAFIQLAVAGTAGLLTYLATAVSRDDMRRGLAAIRAHLAAIRARKPAPTAAPVAG
jgi:PST family polysaccharide transporter